MKSFRKTKTVLWAVLCVLQWLSPSAAMEAEDAPATVTIDYLKNLYEAVGFDHQLHTDMYQCNVCHHHTTGEPPAKKACRGCHDAPRSAAPVSCAGCHALGLTDREEEENPQQHAYHIDIPDFKGSMHLQCLGCHAADSGPTGCQECHAFTPEGRKRFSLTVAEPTQAGFAHAGTSSAPDNPEGE